MLWRSITLAWIIAAFPVGAVVAVADVHWAYLEPAKSPPPDLAVWGNGAIDRFVYSRLRDVGLLPQPVAPKPQIIRRASLDLTGVPPSIKEVDDFLTDQSEGAYERLISRLLSSPRFGERMASWWLDGARYGDSHGYDNDLENTQWPWRNWVIDAFNSNMPFDQFTVEQLAGDLLPNPTESQILATAFNRNHRIQTEDGAIDEEWRTEYVMDRVETMGTVWMGMTLSCARCHDHKYDPISQREFYGLFSFFNNIDEKGFINNLRGSAGPRVRYQFAGHKKAAEEIVGRSENADARKVQLKALDERFPYVMIMREMDQPRKAFVLDRGQYNAPTEQVSMGLPAVLPPLPKGETMSRLGLARWLVSGRHPLTARVLVNRLWEQLFGTGIVASTEDLGVQAESPSHPKLLDWLAVDFVENGWDIKRLMKQMVSSATYRQDHAVDQERWLRDPNNRLLSRGPRVRLAAEMVRDQALAISGLLVEQQGGPSVWTYQPAGLWKDVEKRGTFVQDHGEKLYRRSLYSRIRRTVAPPSMGLFDMPSREQCSVRRARTNTPLQALALMNDVTYVEAAKKFAEQMILAGATPREQIAWGFRCATARQPNKVELDVLLRGFARRMEHFTKVPDNAGQLLDFGEAKVSREIDQAELAAMTTVANILLNLDELVNK